jgi:hypothetical protein
VEHLKLNCFEYGSGSLFTLCVHFLHFLFQLGHPGGRKLTISRGNTQLNVSHNLLVVPGEDKVWKTRQSLALLA